MSEFLNLFSLNKLIKETLNSNLEQSYWIVSEISQINTNSNGHTYLELVEKDEFSDRIIAKSRATIWASAYRMIKPYFETTTGYELKSGIKILIKVIVEFHELYGLSLNIFDIEPSYTLGDIEKRKLEILKNLEDSGVLNMNKEIELPLVPQKIAIISSQTAAGYEDFINQLENNVYRYKYYFKLFPAVMQGNNAEASIISALEKIYEHEDVFDLVVIIRGGGSKTDLACFDSEDLAINICQFPIPVVTGIGHDRDISIADLVAHTSLKTPTAVAEFLISKVNDFELYINDLSQKICNISENFISEQKSIINDLTFNFNILLNKYLQKLSENLIYTGVQFNHTVEKFLNAKKIELKELSSEISDVSQNLIITKSEELKRLTFNLNKYVSEFLLKKNYELELIDKIVQYQNPKNILKRGYSITKYNGKVIKNSQHIANGDIIETELYEDNFISIVKK